MKRFLLPMVAVCAALIGRAETVTPEYYNENFVKMGETSDIPVDGWITYGIDAAPSEKMSVFFNDETDNSSYVLLNYGSICIPVCCTEFADGQVADQWLVSPEIEIPDDISTLSFEACVYGAKGGFGIGVNPFKILVSETGSSAKEDFSETPVFEGSINGSYTLEVARKQMIVPFNGFGGKKVRIAFVAGGKDVGMTGFTNISLGGYYINFDNRTAKVGEEGQKYEVRINLGLKSAVECPGVNTTLYVEGEKTEEKYYAKNIGKAGSYSVVYQLASYPKAISITDKSVNYKLEVTPAYEGAMTSYITGSVGLPEISYIANCVIEEMTSTKCGFCPRGTAALDYYKDTFTGSETEGKAIGIAIHSYSLGEDPMAKGVEDYISKLMQLNSSTSLPGACFNRATAGLDPTAATQVKKRVTETSNNQVTITSVKYPKYDETFNLHGQNAVVTFDARNSYTSQGLSFNMAVLVIENDVVGYNSDYSQDNYFYSWPQEEISANYGSWILPYLSPFAAGGELGLDPVPYANMTYQHVARGIFPSFYGDPMNADWQADVPQTYEYTFQIPETINDWKNTEVIVLMLDNSTNNIVGSDIIPFSGYTEIDESAVKNTSATSLKVAKEAANIVVYAEDGVASIYSADGLLMGQCKVEGGKAVIPVNGLKGAVIVKVEQSDACATQKIIL